MMEESNYNDYQKMINLQKELDILETELENKFIEWESLM
jgi:hypothetical protein